MKNLRSSAPLRLKKYPVYKESGVEWLGNIPADWQIKRLKYTASCNDEVLAESTDHDHIIQYVDISSVDITNGIANIEEMTFEKAPSRARRKVQDGDTIISTVRTYLKAIASITTPLPNLIVSTGFAVIRPKPEAHSQYLAYQLKSQGFVDAVVANSEGVSYPAINASRLIELPIVLPPVDKQKTIASFLDRKTTEIDALIAKKRRMIELLQEKRTAVISHAVTKGLDAKAPLKDSGVEWLDNLPHHWGMVPLKFVLLAKPGAIKTGPFGSQLLSSEMLSGLIKVYNQRNVIDVDFIGGDNYITEEKYSELSAFSVEPRDILVTTRGTIGRCAILPMDAEPGILHPCLMRIQIDERKVLIDYLALLIQDGSIIREQLRLKSNATTIEVIYSDSLKQVKLPLPPISEQLQILSLVNEQTTKTDAMITKVSAAIDKLLEYRTALIAAAVTGKIDVREDAA